MINKPTKQELRAVRRIIVRGILLLSPFVLLLLLQLFVLPVGTFTFRVWEAALSTPYKYPGKFYPDIYVKKAKEYGDYYRHGNPSQIQFKPVEWYTDAYGFRNRPEVEKKKHYDMVIVGDSNIVGSFLDQKNTIAEVLSARSGKVAYSYSGGVGLNTLFFSDPRIMRKKPSLLIEESKVGNWFASNGSALACFKEKPDGTIGIVNRSRDFLKIYDPKRNFALERLDSRLTKEAMLRWLKASLATEFNVSKSNNKHLFMGRTHWRSTAGETVWRPSSAIFSGGIFKALLDKPQPAFQVRASGQTYWKTGRFVSARPDGKIIIRFEARNSIVSSRHRLWIFENGAYRPIGEFVANDRWQRFEIPVATKPGSTLRFQIDQKDPWQTLSVRDVQVIDGAPLPFNGGAAVALPMTGWSIAGRSCDGGIAGCRQWKVGKPGFLQTPLFPHMPNARALKISFEARSEKVAKTFAKVYFFQGGKYENVADYMFGPKWHEYSLLLTPISGLPAKLQIDFPKGAGKLFIRNFRVTPPGHMHQTVHRVDVAVAAQAPEKNAGSTTPAEGRSNAFSRFKRTGVVKASVRVEPKVKKTVKEMVAQDPFPKPPHLAPLNGPGCSLTTAEVQYYFYHGVKAMQRRASERGMDFILFVMPDPQIVRLMPAIKQLRMEGIKVLAYEPRKGWNSGVDWNWYWQKADSHWTEAAVRLTADEILRMWKTNAVANRPFSAKLEAEYSHGFPQASEGQGRP